MQMQKLLIWILRIAKCIAHEVSRGEKRDDEWKIAAPLVKGASYKNL